MALLGTPYKITYWAKNAKTGLSGITAKIQRPDGSIIGPLILTEMTDPSFSGAYTATLSTAGTDPEGNYIVVLSSPNEASHKAFKTVYFEKRADIDISGLDIAINRRQAIEAETESRLQVEAYAESMDMIASFDQEDIMQAYIYQDELEYFIDNNEYIGDINEL